MRKELYLVFDELMEKNISGKNNSMEYIGKNRLKYLNQTEPMNLVRIHF
jgi:hypothetical protein